MSDQQQETLKVYELAKELGLDSFALLDKLKEINIEVKSHMSSLAADQANAIRAALRTEKQAKTKTTVKKRAASTSPKKVVKKTSAGTVATVAPSATETKKAATTGSSKRRVIKRKTSAEDDGVASEEQIEQSASQFSQDEQELSAISTTAEMTHANQELEDSMDVSDISVDAEDQTQKVAPQASPPQRPKPSLDEFIPKKNAPGTKVVRQAAPRVVEKDELFDEFSSRRLKIIQPPPPPGSAPVEESGKPTYRTPGGPASGVERKRPVVAKSEPTSTEMFKPMTSYVQKEEEDKSGNKRGAGNRGNTSVTKPEEVRISDFRKRELVFQPKRKKLPPSKIIKKTEITEMAAHKKKIRMEDKIVVSDLAQRLGEKANTIISKLMQLGSMVTINQTIDFDTAALIAGEFGWEVENTAFQESSVIQPTEETSEHETPRPPIITVMGHVDHGKTSLLDSIRNAKVASGEAGGITQHIGAYSVEVEGKPLTFLDTPGHEAFANMRSRGANVTDIVVLVVAADDSIMPQTKEAIQHAQNANVPIVVAVNKIDKPNANIEKVKKDLSANNILIEEWGGEVPMVPVSALQKTGIDDLLETLLLQAEVLDLKANPDRSAEGVILEARMEKGRGTVSDLLVRKGTLKSGDVVVVGTAYGRIRAMMNDKGQNVPEVLPGFPVEIFGLNEVPSAGDVFNVVKTEEDAKQIVAKRRQKILEERAQANAPKALSLDDLMSKLPTPGVKELNILIKADVFGSAEAIKESIEKIQSDKVKAKVIQCSVGAINENDVIMAKTANAMIIGFNSKPDSKARETAKREKVDIKFYSIIYQLLDDVRLAMEDLLEPLRKETPMGKAEVKQVFTVSKLGTVAGSIITDGKIARNSFARVTRGKDTVCEGKVVSLRRFKDDVSETIKGQECGIGIEHFEAFQPGDVINAFHVELVKQTL